MSARVYDAVARIARHEAEARPTATFGVVTAVHHSLVGQGDHAVDVELRDQRIVLPRVPIAVGALGLTAAPAVDDLALVVFADGDMHAPVVVGFLHHPGLPAPKLAAEQVTLSLPPGAASPAAHALLDYSAPSLTLKIGRDTEVKIEDGAVSIRSGEARIDVDAGGSEEIRLEAGQAKMSMTKSGEIKLEAAKKLTLQAAEIEISADATVSISGAKVDLN